MTAAAATDHMLLRSVVEAGTLSPSIHNTQPWRWELRNSQLDLYADRSRGLQVLDGTGRQLVMSCGAALFHARLALRAAGYVGRVGVLPSEDTDHLARIAVAPAGPPTRTELALAAAMRCRHTQRGPFDPRPVPGDVLNALRRVAETEGSSLYLLHRRDDQQALSALLTEADARENSNPDYRNELRAWCRPAGSSARDGIPRTAVPTATAGYLTLRDFDMDISVDDDTMARQLVEAPPDERPTVAVIGTELDSPAGWLAGGQTMAAVLLRATVAGLVSSPLGQLVDLPEPRAQLRRRLGFIGFPQMVLRLGYGVRAIPTPRRAVDDILTVSVPAGT